ncbi:TPA: DUF1627 domain-containing protein [Escherichia coli]|uniref:DUF1627 domain-containing protein n=5 Tax=Escherichia coli TaxID=562 RepID=UPI000CDD9A90|nr:DUF1627 domain-containing protein [Escherichia coli]EIY9047455.1 DUF1627 domain-containing protein [Escherichia coli]EJB8796003.1 DUF1627 domain-containing protein [Escherichia coli]EKG5179181.1 DUF1627 domain-containing protein [Escherichia coli]MBB7295997.1 DUF1627 domain-containing protein [Escherichia coli]MCQ1734685.1 DUF1627 domain-containing protein [Escherichia coli]
METVFDALKAMGKATSVELAARLDISREEVLNELWELKKAGFVDKSVYTWRVADNNVQQEQPAPEEQPEEQPEEIATATVAKISESDLTATIEQRGPQTADELATLFGTTSRKVASTLAMAISKGRLIRVNQNGKFRYCIPGDNLPAEPKVESVAETDGKAFPQPAGVALPVQEAATQEDIKTETVADIVQSLPSFTETRADDLVLPSLHMANRELRRAKNHVQKWERVCAALRELNKHRDIVRQITDSSRRVVSEK